MNGKESPELTPTGRKKTLGGLRHLYRRQVFHETFWFYVFISVGLGSFILFGLYPTIKTVILSFQEWHFKKSVWVGLENYAKLIKDSVYGVALINTLTYTVWTVVLQVLETLALAILISRLRSGAQGFFRALFYLPGLAGGIAVPVIWLWIFSPMGGVLNYLLGLIGIPPQLWLFDSRLVMPSFIMVSVATVNGGNLLFFLAAIYSVPRSLYEVAELDGTSRLRQAVRITVPLIRPVLLYVIVLSTLGAMQVFEVSWILTGTQYVRGGGVGFSGLTLVYYIFMVAWDSSYGMQFGYAAAQTVALSVYLLVIVIAQFRFLGKQVEY